MSEIVTREQLDKLKCGCCDNHKEEPLYLHSCCHPKSPTWTMYHQGWVKVVCSKCGKPVVAMEVK